MHEIFPGDLQILLQMEQSDDLHQNEHIQYCYLDSSEMPVELPWNLF